MKKSKLHSLKARIILLLVVSIFVSIVVVVLGIISTISKEIKAVNSNYLLDIGIAYGQALNDKESNLGAEMILQPEMLESIVGNAGIRGMDSSYAYVVSGKDGTMLYHPSADGIGTKVDNKVVLNLISQIASGHHPSPNVETYQRNGIKKHIGYYVIDDDAAIVCVVVDENEIMGGLLKSTLLAVAIALIMIIISIISSVAVAGRITKPIRIVTRIIHTMSDLVFVKDEELLEICEIHDETGEMAQALVDMRARLVDIINEIIRQSDGLFAAAEELEKGTEESKSTFNNVETAVGEIAGGATSQAMETQSAAENMTKIGKMIESTQSEAALLSKNADIIAASNQKAADALSELTKINEKVNASIRMISEQTRMTNDSAVKIKDMASLISEIASQTNLLSLNASIEAARAGEAGRGFAVVATEIQQLADQSADSASRIDEVVKVLLDDSARSVQTMDSVSEIVEEQSKVLQSTTVLFDHVESGVNQSIEGIGQISGKADELNKARKSIVEALESLSAIAEQNAASTQETSASMIEVQRIMDDIANNTVNLRSVADTLNANTNKFDIT